MKNAIVTLVVLAALSVSGCAFVCYGRVGKSKAKKVSVVIDELEADPNIAGLFDIGMFKLGIVK